MPGASRRARYKPGTPIVVSLPYKKTIGTGDVPIEKYHTVYEGPERRGWNPLFTGGEKRRKRKNDGFRPLESRDKQRMLEPEWMVKVEKRRDVIEGHIRAEKKWGAKSRNEAIQRLMRKSAESLCYDSHHKFVGFIMGDGKRGKVLFQLVYDPYTRSLLWGSTRRSIKRVEMTHEKKERDFRERSSN